MKRLLAAAAALLLCLNILPTAHGMGTSAGSAILMEAESGRVLYEQDADRPRLIASVTKLMTALVALESGHPLEEKVVIREEDGDILCSVADNGVGIDPQILDKLKLGTIRAQGNGVGLTNLDERLKSLYGPGYGIQVENSPAGGALIRFRVKKEVSGT